MADPTLKRDARGGDVQRLQRALTASGFAVATDGVFGPATEGVVKRFQASCGLVADGVVGSRTWGALRRSAPRPERTPQSRSAGGTLSPAGVQFIARFEGFRGALYDDAAGHCTIGFGHLVHHGRTNGTEPAEFRKGISKERALELLADDAAKAAKAVVERVNVPLAQHQFDALVSFVFNLGAGAFAESTLLRELNAGRYDAVPPQLDRWVKAGGKTLQGLVRRRNAEGVLFSQGRYE
jgi:lysozyme